MKGKKKSKIIKVIEVLALLIAMVLIYWHIPYSPYKAEFNKEMQARASRINENTEVCTAEEIDKLPDPLQRYCQYIGLENSPKHQVVRTLFRNTKFVFNAQAGTVLDMDYDLWLFYDQPYRSAYCTSSMYGVPFDGVDYCTESKEGGMKGILGKAIQIFDVRDSQGYKAGLISWVAESIAINPSALLSPYISYTPIDDLHVKATVHYNGVVGSGIITINEEGAVTEFYSDERQVEEIEGVKTPVGWRCQYEDYKMQDGMRRISTVRSIKTLPDKEITYFDSNNFEVDYLK